MLQQLFSSGLMTRQGDNGLKPRFGAAQGMNRQMNPAFQQSANPFQSMGELELFQRQVLPKANLEKPAHWGKLDLMA